jgi:hypothetical protein
MYLICNSNFIQIFRNFVLCLVLLCSNIVNGQVIIEDERNNIDSNSVTIHSDPRLAILSTYNEPTRVNYAGAGGISGSIHSAKGFRVIIYSGTERAKASATKADFMKRFPGVRVYISYALPQYRVKVGDYGTRQEAQEFYRQLSSLYSPCMVVPDIVEINTFRKND